MKRISIIAIAFILAIGVNAKAQDASSMKSDSTGLPGDNFSLPGALEMFKQAKSLEEFEKLLNQENNRVNNLDLNEDGKIDYVRVIDNSGNNAHAVVLQVPINKTEFQDIAVVEIEKQGDAKVSVQIVGDEDIYGENVIFEPKNEKEVETGDGKGGPSGNYYVANFWFNAWYWPCIQFMYAPAYVVWVSPWYYDYYPYWWSPWRPYHYSSYWGHCHHYHDYYHHSYNHYGHNAYNNYRPNRRSSDYVVNRHRGDVNSYRTNRSNSRRENIASNPRNGGTQNNVTTGRNNNRTNTNGSNYSKPRTEKDNVSRDNRGNGTRSNNAVNSSNNSNRRDGEGYKEKPNREQRNGNYSGKPTNTNREQNNGTYSGGKPNQNRGTINRGGSQSKPSSRPSGGKPSRAPRSSGKR
jgi:hypothetical protein